MAQPHNKPDKYLCKYCEINFRTKHAKNWHEKECPKNLLSVWRKKK